MSENKNTPCGCRYNSTNDTHGVAPVALYDSEGLFLCKSYVRVVADQPNTNVHGYGDGSRARDSHGGSSDGQPCAIGQAANDCLELISLLLGGDEGIAANMNIAVNFTVNDSNFTHVSSPVVAESGAVTPDAPAMTVQENAGAGAVSPSVPAQPRFVQLGASVYDRENDLFFVSVNAAVARLSVAELNNSPALADGYKWEDAK